MKTKAMNEVTLEFPSRSSNEGFARSAVACFAAQLDPTLEEVNEKMAAQGGFAKTMWCGDEACEVRMKEEAGVSSRCIPFEQEHLGDTCAICGKPAKHMVYWGVAY